MQDNSRYKGLKLLAKIIVVVLVVFSILAVIFHFLTKINPPEISNNEIIHIERVKRDTNFYKIENNWLRKSESGLWEMYVSGGPFEMGVIAGKLSQELVYYQEHAFVEQIKELIPSKSYLRFLKYFVSWFNKDLDKYIPIENQMEIYGVSLSADPEFDFIGNNYHRLLNYHAAHDIGHAMQNLNLVACTSECGMNTPKTAPF